MGRSSHIPVAAHLIKKLPAFYTVPSLFTMLTKAHHWAHYFEPDKPGLHPHTYPIIRITHRSSLKVFRLLSCVHFCLCHSCYYLLYTCPHLSLSHCVFVAYDNKT